MDLTTLHKKLSTYLTPKGQLRNLSEELLYEVLVSWEEWSGTAKEFYKTIGFSQTQMASLLGKAKKLKREGYFGSASFKEVHVETPSAEGNPDDSGHGKACRLIELEWKDGKVIRFPKVRQLLEFLQKAG